MTKLTHICLFCLFACMRIFAFNFKFILISLYLSCKQSRKGKRTVLKQAFATVCIGFQTASVSNTHEAKVHVKFYPLTGQRRVSSEQNITCLNAQHKHKLHCMNIRFQTQTKSPGDRSQSICLPLQFVCLRVTSFLSFYNGLYLIPFFFCQMR